MSRRVLLVTLFCNWLLASCGGGGGTTPTVPTNSNVSGVAAVGAALIGASIEVKCIRGTGLATTASDGSFSIDIASAEFPCMVKVSGGTKAGGGANAEVMYSVANAPGRVNVTPLTQLIVSKALSKSAASAYGSFGSVSADISAISAANLTAAQVSLSTEISKIGINANLGSINLFTTAFVPGPTDYVDQYISLVYESLAQNSKSLATASQELTTSTGLQISGTPKAVCRPGVKAGFTAPSGTDAKQAFVPIDVSLSSESGGSPGGSAGGGDGSAGDGSLGQFFSTTVTVEKADGSILGTAKTGESSGGFTMVTCGYAGPLRITMSGTPGSKYFDEGLNQTVSFEGETMRLVIESATKNVGVTPFTDAAHRFLTTKLNTQGLSTSSAWNDPVKIAQANATILATVNRLLPKELFLTDITRMPIVVGPNSVAGSVPDTANGIYGLAIAAFVTQTKNFNPTLARPGIESLKQLADDLGDGVLDRISSSGQGVSSASQAAYSAEALGPSVSASAGQLSKALGVPSLANRRYIVTRTQWRGIGTSYFGLLPRLLNGPPYS